MIQDLSSMVRDKLALPNGEARQVLHFFWPLNYWRCPNEGYRTGCENVWTTVHLFRTTFTLTIIINCWRSASLLKKRPRVQLSAEPTPRALNELKRECYLRNEIRKRSDFPVFWHKDDKTYTPVRSYSQKNSASRQTAHTLFATSWGRSHRCGGLSPINIRRARHP